MTDIGYTAKLFATSGDPTKNVTVVSRASQLIIAVDGTLVGADEVWYSGFFRVDGYSKMTVLVATSYTQNAYSLVTKGDNVATLFTVDYMQNIGPSFVGTYDVTNHEVEIRYHNSQTTFITLSVQIYLVA